MRIQRALAIGATLGLITCTGSNGVSVVENNESGFFSSSEYANDISKGSVVVHVAGTAFNQDPQTFTNAVVNDMQGADWSPHAHFTATPGPNTSRIYSYALMFGDSRDVTDSNLCAAVDTVNNRTSTPSSVGPKGVVPAQSATSAVTLVAALCRYDKSTMGVTARAGDVRGTDDPKFRTLVRSAVLELTRPNQENIQHDRDNGSDSTGGNSGGQH